MKRGIFKCAIFGVSLLFLGFSCRGGDLGGSAGAVGIAEEAAVLAALLAEPQPPVHAFTIVAAGDNLFHDVMVRQPPGGLDFLTHYLTYYAPIRSLIQSADIAFINQETPLGGAEFGFSGWPLFNSPQELGLALIETGFNVVNHANNHALDMRERGLVATMDFWDSHPEVIYLGVHQSQERRDAPAVINANGVRVGFLAYTYGTNGIPVPRNRPYIVSLIDLEIMEAEISALRPLVDFLAVSMHWGYEYVHSPNAEQRRLAAFLAELNVDLVIGHHPHVLQPMEFLPRGDGGRTLVAYSLGNFISAQHDNNTLLGGLLYVEVQKKDGRVSIERAGIIPVVTHYEAGFVNFRVYPIYDYTEELASRHRNRTRADLGRANISLQYFYNLARRVLGDAMIDYDPFAAGARGKEP